MKFFIDTADISAIKECLDMGMCDGVTTNPSLCAKVGKEIEPAIKEIAQIVKGPISAEVLKTDYKGMVEEAEKISKWAPNIVIKIPLTIDGLKAIRTLKEKGIKTNATLVFTANQALLAAKAGATYVSPFIGRLDDCGQDGTSLISEIMEIYKNYNLDTQVIVASIRHPKHVSRAAKLGAHIATIPPEVVKKLSQHLLTDIGLKKFLGDYEKLKK